MENSNQSRNGILIINPPGELQISLQALLTSHLDLDVLAVSEIESALKVTESFRPTLIIIDQNISRKNPSAFLTRIKSNWPEIKYLLLVNDKQSQRELSASNANLVLVKGLRGATLIEEIKSLLQR